MIRLRASVMAAVLAVAFVAALASVNLTRNSGDVELSELGLSSPRADQIDDLREQVSDIERRLPSARSAQLAGLPVPGKATFCGQPVPLDDPQVRDALSYEMLLTVGRPLMPLLWKRRAPGVLPHIEEKLAAAGLPDDLKYVAMIESDLRAETRSPAGAVGVWQFMKPTAKQYGLRVDRYIDERMDTEAATEAAVRYLTKLHNQFGDWFLVMASYNTGETRVSRALDEQGQEKSYFQLYLPRETRRYVYRALTAKLLFENPEAYGLVRPEPLHVPQYRLVEVQVRPSRTDLRELAKEYDLDYADVRLSNPKLRGPWLPRGTHRLRVPVREPDTAGDVAAEALGPSDRSS